MQPTEPWRSLVASYWPADQVDNAMRIIHAESKGDPNAIDYDSNGTTDFGLLQVNSIHSALVGGNLDSLYDPATNVRIAYEVWQAAGWCAWSTAPLLGLCN